MLMEDTKAIEQAKATPLCVVESSRNFEEEREVFLERSERRAWYVAGGAMLVALISVVGALMLAHKPRMLPYIFSVDQAAGNIEFIEAVNNSNTRNYQDLVDKHFAAKYVVARESYLWKLLQTNYDSVLTMSSDEVAQSYSAQFDGDDSLDKRMGKMRELKVSVISVVIAEDKFGRKAVVRYQLEERRIDSGIRMTEPQQFVSTFAFEYKPSMRGKEKDLIENPLGFKVTAYRRDAEMRVEKAAGR